MTDPEITQIFTAVEGEKPHFQEISGCSSKTRSLWHQFKSLVIRNGVLYRRFEDPNDIPEKEQLQFILPEKHVINTIKYYHEQLGEVNHFGIRKTTAHLQRFFWWPGMHFDISKFMTRCNTCARFKGPKLVTKQPMKIFKDGVLHGRWHVDLCGPFPKSIDGYKYALVAIESMSGWPVAVPLKTQTAEETAKALISNVFSVYGSPLAILTDQGTNFQSELLQEVMNLYNIKKYKISARHPAANGTAERWIRVLKEHLAMLVNDDQASWPDYLPFVMQAYRSLPHSSTGFSPYEVMFGSPMRTPLMMETGAPPVSKRLKDDYPYWVHETLDKIHQLVREMQNKAAKRMKLYYDRTPLISPFKEGDKVFLYKPDRRKGISPKFNSPWVGPYTILKIINDCNARIRDDQTGRKQIIHIDRLAAFAPEYERKYSVSAAWLTFA